MPQWPQRIDESDRIGPKVITSQIDMLPTERRQMLEKIRWDRSVRFVKPLSGSFQILGVPKDDSSSYQVQRAGAMPLRL